MATYWKQEVARVGENWAARYCEEQGLKVLDRNWRNGRTGELDLVLLDVGLLIFAEVKTRKAILNVSGISTRGFDSVDKRKQQKIVTLALKYMFSKKLEASCRFDVIVVEYYNLYDFIQNSGSSKPSVIHIPAAFC